MNKKRKSKNRLAAVAADDVHKSPSTTIFDLPKELLLHIFKFCVEGGKVSQIINISRACPELKKFLKEPRLWDAVDDRALGKNHILAHCRGNYFSHTARINLSYVGNDLESKDFNIIFEKCKKLRSINLSLCTNLKKDHLTMMAVKLERIESVNFQKTQLDYRASWFSPLFTAHGLHLTSLNFSNNRISNANEFLLAIAKHCPNLKMLVINDIDGAHNRFPLSKFQSSCPQMTHLEAQCFSFNVHKDEENTVGFRELQTFVCSTAYSGGLYDRELNVILEDSSKLSMLDVRGCNVRESLLRIPSTDLKVLYIARAKALTSNIAADIMLKWRHSLVDVDISKTLDTDILGQVLHALIFSYDESVLEQLDLSSTSVSPDQVKNIVKKCNKLQYLNLESCRYLERGTKRIYYDRKEICDMFLDTEV